MTLLTAEGRRVRQFVMEAKEEDDGEAIERALLTVPCVTRAEAWRRKAWRWEAVGGGCSRSRVEQGKEAVSKCPLV